MGGASSIRAFTCFPLSFRVLDLPLLLLPPPLCFKASTHLRFAAAALMAEEEYLHPDALGLALHREDVGHSIGHISEAVRGSSSRRMPWVWPSIATDIQ